MSRRQVLQTLFLNICATAATFLGFVYLLEGKFVHGLLSMIVGGVWAIWAEQDTQRWERGK